MSKHESYVSAVNNGENPVEVEEVRVKNANLAERIGQQHTGPEAVIEKLTGKSISTERV